MPGKQGREARTDRVVELQVGRVCGAGFDELADASAADWGESILLEMWN